MVKSVVDVPASMVTDSVRPDYWVPDVDIIGLQLSTDIFEIRLNVHNVVTSELGFLTIFMFYIVLHQRFSDMENENLLL